MTETTATGPNPPSPTFYFGIPLRSAASSRNWAKVGQLLDRTIASALDPNGADVAVIIACHDVPPKPFRDDPRVTFLIADIPTPATSIEQLHDKRHKKHMVAREVCRRGGGYVMMLDADDLVSNRLAAHVLGDDNRRGYLIDKGFVFDIGRQHLERTELFDQRCGSCAVFWLNADDARGPDDWSSRLADAKHKDFAQVSRSAGRALDRIPFPSCLYVFNNGENISLTAGSRRGPRIGALLEKAARVANRLLPGRRVPGAVRSEFGLTGPLYD